MQPHPPEPSEANPESLRRYLLSFRWATRDEALHRAIVEGGLPLWRRILSLVPNPGQRGRALEIGSPPFQLTLLLQRLRNYDLSLGALGPVGVAEAGEDLDSPEYGERYALRAGCFDAECDRLPYADRSFDLVLCCEVIEHFREDPVHALAEIHRVLRPGGQVVISTQNATRAANVQALLGGRNVYDVYHLGAQARGTRHQREYTLAELRDLAGGCGFAIARSGAIDLVPPEPLDRGLMGSILQNVAGRLAGTNFKQHLFLLATKEGPFRWYYPPALFDQGHLAWHTAPRNARVVVGENDAIHFAGRWDEPEPGLGGTLARRTEGADVILIAPEGAATVVLAVSDGAGHLRAWHDTPAGPLELGACPFQAPPGSWTTVTLPLDAEALLPGHPLHLRLEAPGGVLVRAVAAE